jgi:hypothetical protein
MPLRRMKAMAAMVSGVMVLIVFGVWRAMAILGQLGVTNSTPRGWVVVLVVNILAMLPALFAEIRVKNRSATAIAGCVGVSEVGGIE